MSAEAGPTETLVAALPVRRAMISVARLCLVPALTVDAVSMRKLVLN
jgi:hypothetical protein